MKYYRDHLSDFTRPYPETEAGLALLKSLGIPLVEGSNITESKCFFFMKNKVVVLTFFCDKSTVKYWKPLFAKVANDFYIVDK